MQDANLKPRNVVIPRLPSDPEFVDWKGNKEVQQNNVRLPYDHLWTQKTLQEIPSVTSKPISKIIEEFPQDLLSPAAYIENTLPPEFYETEESSMLDSAVTSPLFPIIEPHFLVPFSKFRDGLNKDTSFLGSIVKPALKKIAMDQTETFLDRILSDNVDRGSESSTRSLSNQSSEDGWR